MRKIARMESGGRASKQAVVGVVAVVWLAVLLNHHVLGVVLLLIAVWWDTRRRGMRRDPLIALNTPYSDAGWDREYVEPEPGEPHYNPTRTGDPLWTDQMPPRQTKIRPVGRRR